MQEMQVQSVGQENPLEREMATHSNILAWEIPWTEEPGRLQAMGSQRIGYNLATKQQQQWLMVPKWNISVSTEVLLDNTNLVQSHSLWLMNWGSAWRPALSQIRNSLAVDLG